MDKATSTKVTKREAISTKLKNKNTTENIQQHDKAKIRLGHTHPFLHKESIKSNDVEIIKDTTRNQLIHPSVHPPKEHLINKEIDIKHDKAKSYFEPLPFR
ncbi:MAG: hypothetical protein LBD68_11490 [Zoogloeaceae bacterium]|jgi:hypothetical protein|nr:hypothetical protein [Zoogloeaceae bacterium]